jgi:radical SAM-linked protein
LGGQEVDAVLAWDHIDCGVNKSYLQKEWELAHQERATLDCRSGECNQCGVCDFVQLSPRVAAKQGAESESIYPSGTAFPTKRLFRIRLRFSKTGEARFLSHLETVRVFSRAARRAKIPLRFSQGFHPKPKIAFGPALPVGVESISEHVDIQLVDRIPISDAQDALNMELPKGLSVFSGKEISLKTPAIADSLYETSYTLRCVGLPIFDALSEVDLARAVERFLSQSSVCIARFRKERKTTVDIRAAITELSLSRDRMLTFTLRSGRDGRAGPTEVIKGVFGVSNVELAGLAVCKTRMELKESWDRS